MKKNSQIPAGDFYDFLSKSKKGIKNSTVPCGECTGCCTSSYFKRIEADEEETLKRIPKNLLSYSPGIPDGAVLLGYDEKGHCTMLKDNSCSIYEDRPQTCRDFDCRIFLATGLDVEEDEKGLIAKRVNDFVFSYENHSDKIHHKRIKETATFLEVNYSEFPENILPDNSTQLAQYAIQHYEKISDFFDDEGSLDKQIDIHTLVNRFLE